MFSINKQYIIKFKWMTNDIYYEETKNSFIKKKKKKKKKKKNFFYVHSFTKLKKNPEGIKLALNAGWQDGIA